MNIIAFADLHDVLTAHEVDYVKNEKFDICVVLGDIDIDTLSLIKLLCGDKPIIGIHGNHDPEGVLSKCGILDLHCDEVKIEGLTFVGFGGCLPYKIEEKIYLYSQMQCSMMLDKCVGSSDVIISHNSPYGIHDRDDYIHTGYKGLVEYIEKHNPRLCIHGHQHVNSVTELDNGTKVIGVNRIQLIKM